MKVYIIATVLAVTSITSVSSAMCMKKFLNSVGMSPSANTNFYNEVKRKSSESSGATTASTTGDGSHRQR